MLVALVMLGVTACEQDVTIDTPKSEGLSFYAEIAMTRADLVQGIDDSKWTTVWEGNETLYVNEFAFTNTESETSKFTCTAEGVAKLLGEPVTIKMENNSVPESGKGIMIEQPIESFNPESTITLTAKNAFFHFTYTGDVTFTLSQPLFVVDGAEVETITVTADGDTWVSVLPGTADLSYTIDGIKCKEKSDFAINAGKIYYLNSKVEITDTLDRELTGVTGTSYTDWSDKTVTSTAVYAGQSAGGNESIQLRSNNSNSGIVTTASAGKVTKVVVDWNSNTASGRTLNIYGKNTAYDAATDLYDSTKRGTLLGTIVCGTSTELVIEGDYEYIGMRSASNAMYLNEISITWKSQMDMSPTLNVSRNEINFSAEGGEETFTIYKNFVDEVIVNCDNFSVVANEDDTYTVSATSNALSEEISGTVTISAGNITKTINVTQAPAPKVVTVEEFLAAAEDDNQVYILSGTITNVVNTNFGNFYLTDDTGTVYIYGLYNEEGASDWVASGAQLGCDITIKTIRSSYNGSAQGANSICMNVASGTRAFWTFDKTNVNFASVGGQEIVTIEAFNLKESVNVDSDNTQFSATYADGKLTITAAENTTTEVISGNITVTSDSLSQIITVTQTARGEVTKTYTFSDYTAGTQYADGEEHVLDDVLTITTTDCHFTSELRIYSSSTYNGYAIGKLDKGTIKKLGFNAGNKPDTLNVYGSTDGSTWTLIEGVSVSGSYADYTVDFGDTNYTYFKLDVDGTNQIRVKSLTLTYAE